MNQQLVRMVILMWFVNSTIFACKQRRTQANTKNTENSSLVRLSDEDTSVIFNESNVGSVALNDQSCACEFTIVSCHGATSAGAAAEVEYLKKACVMRMSEVSCSILGLSDGKMLKTFEELQKSFLNFDSKESVGSYCGFRHELSHACDGSNVISSIGENRAYTLETKCIQYYETKLCPRNSDSAICKFIKDYHLGRQVAQNWQQCVVNGNATSKCTQLCKINYESPDFCDKLHSVYGKKN